MWFNMSKKILIVYRSRYGATEEVSISFKNNLEKKGFIVDLINLKTKKKPIIKEYSAILIGSGIRMGRWTREAKNFLKNNVATINSTKMQIGVFICSGEAANAEERPAAIEKYLLQVFSEFGLELDDHILYDAFGGVYDLSESSKLSWFMKRMMNMAADDDPIMIRDERVDTRDWNQIDTFIQNFIKKIENNI